MADSPETLPQIVHRIDELEQRVWVLEHQSDAQAQKATSGVASPPGLGLPDWPAQSGSIFPVLGIAMLGMAGSYLLRAVGESGVLPNIAAVALGTIYAGAWLVAAAKLQGVGGFSRATYACVSALTLAPMLWESTSRFHYLSAAGAAAVLAAFLVASYALAWTARISSVIWISTLATAGAAIVLSVLTRELIAFAVVLLGMALLNEIAGGLGRWTRTRAVSAATADFLVWALIFVYSRPAGARGEYPEVGADFLLASAMLLFAIYGVSGLSRAIFVRHTMTYAEITQLVISAVLALDAVLHFATAGEVLAFAIGCIGLSLVSYAGLFLQFHPESESRNYFVCATSSAVLMLVGCSLAFDIRWLPPVLGALGMVATVLAAKTSRPSFTFHAVVYLIGAGYASHALGYGLHSFVGAFPALGSAVVWMTLAAAVLCYAAGPQCMSGNWKHRALHIISAGLATGAAVTACMAGVVWALGLLLTPTEWHIAVIRTLSLSIVAIAIAALGSRFSRQELVWLSYTLLVLLAAKLMFEDLHHGHAEFIAASIFVYALTLIAVPRLVRKAPRPTTAVAPADSHISASAIQHR